MYVRATELMKINVNNKSERCVGSGRIEICLLYENTSYKIIKLQNLITHGISFKLWNMKFIQIIFKNSVPTAKKTTCLHYKDKFINAV
jgi:hypothetical protein